MVGWMVCLLASLLIRQRTLDGYVFIVYFVWNTFLALDRRHGLGVKGLWNTDVN